MNGRYRRLPALVCLTLALGACGESPTLSRTAAPARYEEGGMGYGSGNRNSSVSSTTAAVPVGTTAGAAMMDGGMGYGSGN